MNEIEKEKVRSLTVEVLLDLRAAYLRTPRCSVLKHWSQLQDRMRAATRQSESPEEWLTTMVRTLGLDAPQASSSRSFRDLADFVRERGAAREWLSLLEREYGYVMAVARGVAEQRKEATTHA